ncbi:lipopolysaccharide transport periplasmic protein LptA [Pseudooceanicola sp. 216_PA32_1]|uniref:Lipopolysaccharide transport periplasmic protein LptA n=1 Tax=Pseudooceanicola pacificus TaxID=2676438 RepID=A0A844VYL3_9RHOB|nr:lipopolysaccharide transport periplasmic protein LptA [Pseudooceanicola pacificus]MWB76826.1 lipopolysaccharide transport periplasmic protein LptA [Pseudooceanicola pacificus]
MTTLKRHALAALCLLLLPLTAAAQSTTVAFGSGERDPDAPIEVESDNLEVIEANNTAEFTGNVIVVQEAMTLTAPRLLVIYSDDQSRVERMEATGGVTFVNGAEAAESVRADYDVDRGVVVLTEDVVLVQGPDTITGNRATIDLNAGTAQMEGRVRTILNPKGGGAQGDGN